MSIRQKLTADAARGSLYPLLGVTLAIAAWGFLSLWTDPVLLPSPLQVFRALLATLSSGEFITALLSTLRNILIAFVIGSVLGVALGLIVGGLKPIELLLAPYIYSAYSLPKIALVPLFVVWLGIGPKTIIVVTCIAVALLVAISGLLRISVPAGASSSSR
jgi:ABC-type nitrate/sulfonate/bicarbonate transport system permease component